MALALPDRSRASRALAAGRSGLAHPPVRRRRRPRPAPAGGPRQLVRGGGYCAFASRRLPTEAEWEIAASTAPTPDGAIGVTKSRYPWGEAAPDARRANLDGGRLGCVDVAAYADGDSAWGCRQMLGNVWEWTASDFLPYPGFSPDVYREYSEPAFGTRKVLRGGAWITRGRMVDNAYRNFSGRTGATSTRASAPWRGERPPWRREKSAPRI